MPPKGKGFSGKENPKPGVGGGGSLRDFQEIFKQFKSNPDASAKKNAIFDEVERFIGDSGGQADRLARLCLARMKYELYSNDSKAYLKERKVAEEQLRPLLESNPRSLLAFSLLTAWYQKAATKGYDTWSVADYGIRNLRVKHGIPDSFEESEWTDPGNEAINVTGSKEAFEDFKDGKTKLERMQPLIEAVKPTERTLMQPTEAPQPTDATAIQFVTQPDRAAAANVAEILSKRKYLDEERRRDEEVARIMDVIMNKLKEHGPEGSSERVQALCDLFAVTTEDFETKMGDEIDKWLGEYGAQSMLKNYYTQQLSKQLRRLRSMGRALELRCPDLQEILNSTYSQGSTTDAGVSVGAISKDDKGDVPVTGSSSARGSTGRKAGSKTSAKDQDKRVASVDDSSVPAAVTDVYEFLEWFVNGLKEHGIALRNKVIDEALSELMDGHRHLQGDDKFLKSYKVPGHQLVQALQLLPPEDTCAEQDSDTSLSSHIANRMLMGDVLLNAALAPDGLRGSERRKMIDETTRQRVQFASDLSRIPVLHRHEIVSVLASSIAVTASITDYQMEASKALMCASPFDLPPEPEMVLEHLGDPFIVLEGYAYMLCHKKLLPMRGERVQVDGWDETDMRLLRLCNWILHAKEFLGGECIMMAITLHESTKQEHVEMVRRLCGEMPLVLAKRLRKLQGAGAEVPSQLLNGSYTAGSNCGGAPSLDDNNADSEANNGASDEGHADLGSWLEAPFLDFDIRTDLAAADRNVINARWRQDIMDTMGALQEGGCGLGRRLSSTISSYIAEALDIKRPEVALTNDALLGSLTKMDTGHLLKLRFFLLSQLGLRAQGTLTGMRHRFEEFERSAKDEQWCLEVVPDAGRKGEKLRLSSDAFWRLYHKSKYERRRRIVRLRILHAVNQATRGIRGSTGSVAPMAIMPSSAAQAGGGGKKKGKGTVAVLAAGAGDGSSLTLPPLPPGVQPLENVNPHELFDYRKAESLPSEAHLCLLLPSPEPVCTREVLELLKEVLDPIDAGRAAAKTEVEASVVAELVMSSSQLKYPSHDFIPVYTVVEVIEDLTRVSVLENVRKDVLHALQAGLKVLLKNWDGLNDVFREKGELRQFLAELQPHVSDWLCDLLKQKVQTQGQPSTVPNLLSEIEDSKRMLTAKAFELQSRTIRYSVLHYAARAKANRAIQVKLSKLLNNSTQAAQASQQPSQPPQGGKAASKQSKARQGEESKRNEDLLTEQRHAAREKEFLEEMRQTALKHAEKALALEMESNGPQIGMTRLSEYPSDAAKRLLAALQAAQFLAFQCMILEMIIEEIQHQARISLAYALTNEPVIDAGLIGTSLPQNWMYNKLKDAVAEINKASLLEEEEAKTARDRERKQAADQKRRMKEREEAPKPSEEEEAFEQQQRKEREEQEERERKEREERERKESEEQERAAQHAEEARKGGSRMSTMLPPKIDVDAEDEADAAAAATEAKAGAEKQRAQQQGGKGASEPSPSGRRDSMAARFKEKEQKYHHQGLHDGRGRKEGMTGQQGAPSGPVSARGEPGQRKGSAGQQQQQQQQHSQPSQNATQIKQRDGSGGTQLAHAGGTGAASAGAPGSGRDTCGKGGQASYQPHSGSGKSGQLGGSGTQQQQAQGGKGSQSAKSAGGAGGGGGSGKGASAGPPAAPQQRIVPGFDPAHNQRTDSQKPKQRRPRRGGGGVGQGDTASSEVASGTTITGPKEPVTWSDSTGAFAEAADEKPPHPPVSAMAEGEGDVDVVLDLTEPEQQLVLEADQQETQYEDHMAKYPYVHPYPFDPPEGWVVHEGFLFPADQDPEAIYSEHGKPPDGDDLSCRKVFFVVLANGILEDPMYGKPRVPLEAYKTAPVLETQSTFYETLSAGSGTVLTVAGGAISGSGSPQPTFNPSAPPFGIGGAPGPWPPYTGLPPQMPIPPFGLPYVGPQGMLPMPYPGMLPTQYPYGVPQQLHPPYPPMPVPDEQHEDSGTEEEVDTEEDLLDMLLQRQGASTEVGPPPPPAYAPLTQGIPGPGGFPMTLPFGVCPPMARVVPPVRPLNLTSELEVKQHPATAQPPSPYSTQIPQEPPPWLSARATTIPLTAAAPSSARQMSWAERTRPGASVTSSIVLTVRRPLSPTEDEELQDTEENQMRAAMHQSMRDNMNAAFPPLGVGPLGSGSSRPAGVMSALPITIGQEQVTVPGGAMGTGLVNRVGEYNCFLNVIIQCLWHCVAFRGRLQAMNPADFDSEHRVVAALLRLFHALDAADFVREQQLTHSEMVIERHVVDPSELREALDALGVRAGEMNDASEVMGALFECLNRAPGLSGMDGAAGSGTLSVVDRTFGLLLSEEVRCTVQTCHRITHVVPQHIEYFMILTATGLRDMRAVIDAAPGEYVSTGRIIREIESQNVKRCDSDPPHHGCNTPTPVTRTLHNVPAVFTVQLAWEPDVPGEAIAGTLSLVDTVLDPKEIFAGGNCPGNMPSYALHGMFCYYGQHYFAFINRGPQEPESAQEWVMFDDATVLAVGNWSQVITKCRAGRIQPSVLFYQQYI